MCSETSDQQPPVHSMRFLHFIRHSDTSEQLGFSGYIWNRDTILSSSRCFTLKQLRQQLSRHSVLNWTLEEGEKDFMEGDGLAGWLLGSEE